MIDLLIIGGMILGILFMLHCIEKREQRKREKSRKRTEEIKKADIARILQRYGNVGMERELQQQ